LGGSHKPLSRMHKNRGKETFFMTLPWFTALIRDNGMVCETNPWFFVYAEFMALWSC